MQDLRARPSARDEALFLLRMATKCPLQFELPSCHSERFWGVGVVTDCRSSIEPLVLCAVMNSVSMSLPSDAFWDVDSISVDFNEINSHGDVERITEVVDNIAGEGHAEPVAWRMRAGVQAELDRATFWDRRSMAFPNLVFAPGTQQHVEGLDPASLQIVFRRFRELDEASEEWGRTGSAYPRWRSKVSPESDTVRNNPTLLNARKFVGSDGANHVFELHARFGSGGRIHLRLDNEQHVLEIGYVGAHLPLG